jgi:uncharacterized protein (TIGR03118 family)
MKRSRWIALAGVALAVVLATAGTAAGASRHHRGGSYTVTPLVGNLGDGLINTYRQDHKGRSRWSGRLLQKNKRPVWIDGLWGIGFGNGEAAGPVNSLSFAAGPGGEMHGLYGVINADRP